ncbi:hypothetical protein AMTR_s00229p00014040 [Amborella trichopoda]|uniref:Uncharacterized protein n=1 Tax=Amborella trichopoda TaxID=13333 RepID=W1NU91_AMBTC|nr:hypothetical protein AMTR_s00229p00014040 [Amborella trichopoda]
MLGQSIALGHHPLPCYEPPMMDFLDEEVFYTDIEYGESDPFWTVFFYGALNEITREQVPKHPCELTRKVY